MKNSSNSKKMLFFVYCIKLSRKRTQVIFWCYHHRETVFSAVQFHFVNFEGEINASVANLLLACLIVTARKRSTVCQQAVRIGILSCFSCSCSQPSIDWDNQLHHQPVNPSAYLYPLNFFVILLITTQKELLYDITEAAEQ